jgi:hypothetical protein
MLTALRAAPARRRRAAPRIRRRTRSLAGPGLQQRRPGPGDPGPGRRRASRRVENGTGRFESTSKRRAGGSENQGTSRTGIKVPRRQKSDPESLSDSVTPSHWQGAEVYYVGAPATVTGVTVLRPEHRLRVAAATRPFPPADHDSSLRLGAGAARTGTVTARTVGRESRPGGSASGGADRRVESRRVESRPGRSRRGGGVLDGSHGQGAGV